MTLKCILEMEVCLTPNIPLIYYIHTLDEFKTQVTPSTSASTSKASALENWLKLNTYILRWALNGTK